MIKKLYRHKEDADSTIDILYRLEAKEKFVFHGTKGKDIKILEPRQATDATNGRHIDDGKPAVFASQSANYAICMAIINRKNCPDGVKFSCGFENGVFYCRATKDTLRQLKPYSSGYVYVFDRTGFKKFREGEWVSYSGVTPVKIIKVKYGDYKLVIGELPGPTEP